MPALSFTGTTLMMEGPDDSPAVAKMTGGSGDATSGRSVVVVDQLAKAWDSRPAGDGNTVWAQIDAR